VDYDELLKYVRSECRVRVHKDRSVVSGTRGTFQVTDSGPLITVAQKGLPKKKLTETLIHEYGHYLQHKDGFMSYIDGICDSYTVAAEWFAGRIELSDFELQVVRNGMLVIEYDAERRAHQFGLDFNVKNFTSSYYLKGAAAYMDCIKWTFLRRVCTSETPCRKSYEPRLLTNEELFAPLGAKKIALMDACFNLQTYPG